jgi:subfamily B ATP-binding cassette protein MsbA
VTVGFGLFMGAGFVRLRPVLKERGRLNAEIVGRLNESLGGIRIVKTYTAEPREARVFAHRIHRLLRNVAAGMTAVAAGSALGQLAAGAIGAIIMVMGGRSVLAGTMSLGDLFLYMFLAALLAPPLTQLVTVTVEIAEAVAGLDRVSEIVRLGREDDDAGRQSVEDIAGHIAFDHVSFEYEPGVPVLRDVSLEAPAGSTTALVGPSGAGKSTLVSLVMALNRPVSGRLLVDGQDLEHHRLRDYRSHLGVVLQDNFIFDGTIAENIRFARPQAGRDEVERAGRIAHCAEFVERFPNGYDTVVGERGVKLSGGQRQRVAIARAILADPRVLVLDEATSSLDAESEALIQDGLRSLRRGRTTFVIAHRLSTVRGADQILVLDAGRIVERGSHDALMTAGGRYRELYEKQYHAEREPLPHPGEPVGRRDSR